MRNPIPCHFLVASLLGVVLSCSSQAGEAPVPGVVVAAGITKDCEKLEGNSLEAIPADAIVQRVHVNLKAPRHVRVSSTGEAVSAECRAGVQWLTAKKR
jgi:hypothetical protein